MQPLTKPLRRARANDAPTIAAYHRRCWAVSFRSIVEPEVMAFVEASPLAGVVALWETRIHPDSTAQVVVVPDDDDRPIGHVMVDGAELVHLFIDPDHHRQGWGRTLLDVGERMIADGGHTTAELHTMVGNTPAIALYEATGWTMSDELLREDLPNGSHYHEHVLYKALR